jgi:hypothetical protein
MLRGNQRLAAHCGQRPTLDRAVVLQIASVSHQEQAPLSRDAHLIYNQMERLFIGSTHEFY